MVISITVSLFQCPCCVRRQYPDFLYENMSTLVLFSTRYKFQLATLWLVKDFFVFFYNSAVIIVTAIEKLGHCLFIVGSLGSPYGNEKYTPKHGLNLQLQKTSLRCCCVYKISPGE